LLCDTSTTEKQNALDFTESQTEGQGDANFDAVLNPLHRNTYNTDTFTRRGLDNAGKTTIVKKIMGEDVNSVSPTLGFIIKTIDYEGYAYFCSFWMALLTSSRYKLNICESTAGLRSYVYSHI